MLPTDGMVRGMRAIDTGDAITMPVGKATLGRVLNVIGVVELFYTTNTVAGAYYTYFEAFFVAMIVYFVMTFTCSSPGIVRRNASCTSIGILVDIPCT